MLPLVYHEDYVTPLPEGHRFPMPKFGLLRDHLIASGAAAPEQFHAPRIASRELLATVHDRAYVDAFCDGTLDAKAVRRIGLPWSAGLALRTRTAVGGTLLTARLALEHGLAANCAGGTHHAHFDFGSGFCIFNDLAVAAKTLLAEDAVDQVLIVDLDVHQGDGTATLLADEPRAFTFSVHCGKNFPMRKPPSDLDVPLPPDLGDAGYLAVLRGEPIAGVAEPPQFLGLPWLLEQTEPDLVLYDAGVDPHRDDALGKLALTDAGLYERDAYVLAACRDHGIPVACVIGGGYDKDHARLAARHATIHRAALAQWQAERDAAPA